MEEVVKFTVEGTWLAAVSVFVGYVLWHWWKGQHNGKL